MNPRISMRKPQKQLLLPLFHDFSIIGFSMHSMIMGHLGSDATAAASITSVAQELITCVCKGFSSGAGIMVGNIVCGIFPAGGDSVYDAKSVFFASWCFALPLALLGTFVFHWPVIIVYILMCSDEIIKLPWLYPRYRKYLWLKNLTREEKDS